ncbi:MAG: tetratricopeptide repeat protein [Spirochaetaceae bacterium]|nr:tetratricopeptide repeat protein [Spirochaetaceae bacterium]MBO7484619.1 tetratricopeptide repeat protein [Spirochaetaceae bacterium]
MSDLFDQTTQLDLIPEITASEEDPKLKEISDLSKQGYAFLKENNIEKAIDSFNKILKIDDNNNYALVGLGDSQRKQRHFTEATDYYNQCLRYHPGNNYALFGLADCYKAMNQYHKAIEIWERYLVHDDKNITVLTRVADAYRKIRDFKKSKNLYLQVLDVEEDNAYALIGLGHLHYDFKEYRDALYYWTKMYDSGNDAIDIRVLTSIGNCYRKLKTFDKGVHFFSLALDMEPNNFYALFGLADCYRGLNQHSKSIIYWNKILENDPGNKVILTRAGDACRNMGDFETATQYYQKALDIEFDIYAVLGLALISKAQGNYEEAIASLSKLIQGDPKNYRLYMDIADCYIKNGQKKQAIEALQTFQRYGIRCQVLNEYLDTLLQEK